MPPDPTGAQPAAADRRVPAAPALLLAVGLLLVVLGRSFDGWFVDDDVLNMRWVLEHRDAPWTALTERHAMHNHVRPFALLTLWLGAQLSDGDWWGVHAALCAALSAVAAGAGALASRRAEAPAHAPSPGAGAAVSPGRGAAVSAAALLLLVASQPFRDATGWNAWLGTAGEVAAGLGATACFAAGVRTRRPGLVALGAAAVLVAGLFKEPGWLVGPAVAAGLAAAELRAGRRDVVTWGLGAVLLLAPAGMAWSWHPANAAQYLADARPLAERVGDGLVLAGRALAGAPRLGPVGSGAGLVTPLLFAALTHAALTHPSLSRAGLPPVGLPGGPSPARRAAPLLAAALGLALGLLLPDLLGPALLLLLGGAVWARRAEPPAELLFAGVATLLMLPDPDLHPVHLLGAAAGLAAFTAGTLPSLLATLPRPAALLTPLLLLGWAIDALRPAPPPAAAALLSGHLRPLAALSRTLGAEVLVLPPDDRRPDTKLDAAGAREVYVREATRRLAPLFGLGSPREGARREVLAVYLDGAELHLDPTRERTVLERNRLRELPPVPWGGPATPTALGAGWYAVGALYRAHGGEKAPAVEARDTCGHTWRTPATSPEQAFRLTPFELDADCLPLALAADGPFPPGVFPMLLGLEVPTLSLRGAPVEPALLDVYGRDAQPTPLPRVDEPDGG